MPAFVSQLTNTWRQLKITQRVTIGVAAFLTLALIGTLVYFSSQPEYGVLFGDLKATDAQAIVEKLKADNVPYQLSNNGTSVSVPASRITELRLQMASAGVISGGHVGFDLFDKQSFGATDFTQQVNYKRAIEGELARTLEGMDEVEQVRVHITPAKESIFTEKTERAKASVMLRVRQGRELSGERTESIVNLVSSAVENLDSSDVSVLDTRGRVLSSSERNGGRGDAGKFNSQIESRRRLESETAARIVTLLEPITGAGHVRADVAAELDFSQVEQTEEKYNPQSQVIRSQQTSQESRNSAPARGGITGARAADPTLQSAPAPTANNASGDQRAATTTNFEIDKTVRRTTGGGARITRLSASVVVDYKSVNGVGTTRTPEELDKMQQLVTAAIGIDANRGDQIVVQTIPFDQPTLEPKDNSLFARYKEFIPPLIKYGALIFATLLLILFVIRPAKRTLRIVTSETKAQLNSVTTRALGSGQDQLTLSSDAQAQLDARRDEILLDGAPRTVAELEAAMLSDDAPQRAHTAVVRTQLVEKGRTEPELLAMTVRGWMQESKA